MGPTEIAVLLLCLLAIWLAWDQLKVREAANTAMRAACEARGFFFLDDTVSLRRLRPVRDDEGRVRLRRDYEFQYSDTGHNRREGTITLIGSTVIGLEMSIA